MFTLIDLPYASLAPVIGDETLAFHHGKHLQGYVDNLNKLVAGTEFESMSLEDIVVKSSGAIFNNAGQILNHELYFTQFAPCHSERSEESEESPLFAQIIKQWGSVDTFKAEADNPVAHGLRPLLTFDVWEHAYYLDYQNRRAAHLHELWKILDWSVIEARY